ncbi:MAG: porin family protein [Hyphomicrobiales bacterium]|nr:porin family protein [Hyphomicrobiales bacterium]
MRHLARPALLLALAGAAAPAFASDLPPTGHAPATAPMDQSYALPAMNWTGFHVGGYGGMQLANVPANGPAQFADVTSGLFGLEAGYDMQFGQMVAGVEGDYGWAFGSSRQTYANGSVATAQPGSLATLRLRAGLASGPALFYGTAGWAGGTLKSTFLDLSGGAPGVSNSQTNWLNGYALGGGVAYAFAPNVTVKAEYLHTSLGKAAYFSGADATSVGESASVIRLGVDYKF